MKINYICFILLIFSAFFLGTGCINKSDPKVLPNSTETPAEAQTRPTAKWMTLPDYGTILVDNNDVTLYRMDGPCDAKCETRWTPLMRRDNYNLLNEPGFSYIQRGTGDAQVAYNKAPLYYFSQDKIPGDTKGLSESSQWHLVQPGDYPNGTKPEAKEPKLKEFKIAARQWEFVPNKISVYKGDKVRLIITSTDVKHGFKMEAFDIDEPLEPNKTRIIEFTANKIGEFPFYCNVFCGRGHNDMTGVFIVK